MLTIDFLKKIWPDGCWYFVAKPNQYGGYKHYPTQDIETAAKTAESLCRQGLNVYFACAGYAADSVLTTMPDGTEKKQFRVQRNVQAVKALWLDLDVGPKATNYATQAEAVTALRTFVKTVGLPKPMIVNSGRGIHVYWPMTEAVTTERWVLLANKLKAVAASQQCKTDTTRTSDSASVLRPVGTANMKDPTNPLPVTLLMDAAPNSYEHIDAVLTAFMQANTILPLLASKPKMFAADPFMAALGNVYENSPVLMKPIIQQCAQMQRVAASHGNVEEPIWYASLSIARFSTNPDAAYTRLSDGHPDYSPEATERKVWQLVQKDMGPATCAKFESVNPSGCVGCAKRSKITSPIQLGRQVIEAEPPRVDAPPPVTEAPTFIAPPPTPFEAPAEPTIPNPPPPFRREANGGLYVLEKNKDKETGEETEDWVKFYDYDIYPVARVMDECVESEEITFRLVLPHDGHRHFKVRLSAAYDVKALGAVLGGAGIVLPFQADRNRMIRYMLSYIQKLQAESAAARAPAQMGWREDKSFVNGRLHYHPDGSVTTSELSDTHKNLLAGLGIKGELAQWQKAADAYVGEGNEAYAWTVLQGFAAPLFKFTGFHGAISNALGTSGTGKSTALQVACSVFGHPEKLWVKADDTAMSILAIMGALNHLPMGLDEITNMEPERLSELCYTVSQGRGRHRLNQAGNLRKNIATWDTFLPTTSNADLIGKLASHRADSSPEAMRVFQYRVVNPGYLSKAESQAVFGLVHDNYGVAGDVFMRHVVANLDQIQDRLHRVTERVDAHAKIQSSERFWGALVACVLTAGITAKKLGLVKYDIEALAQWAYKQIDIMRGSINEQMVDPSTMLADFLNSIVHHTLTVKANPSGIGGHSVIGAPNRDLRVRVELDTNKLYIAKAHVAAHCVKTRMDMNRWRDALRASGELLSFREKKNLGAGTTIAAGLVPVWTIDLNHPALTGHEITKPALKVVPLTKEA